MINCVGSAKLAKVDNLLSAYLHLLLLGSENKFFRRTSRSR